MLKTILKHLYNLVRTIEFNKTLYFFIDFEFKKAALI